VKNYLAVGFKLDYVKSDGDISNYYPDFIVKLASNGVIIVETKGRQDLEVEHKISRLKQWCEDVNRAASSIAYDFVFVDEESFNKYAPKNFSSLLQSFLEFK
jgi:type III restriction enzyme